MSPKGLLGRAQRLSSRLHPSGICSIPGAHDKILESNYFLYRMMASYHEPDEFRWNLHAFAQALSSFNDLALIETQGDEVFQEFRDAVVALRELPDIRKLTSLRNQLVHKEPLLAASTAWAGMFRGSKMKLAFNIPIPTYLPTSQVLCKLRNESLFLDPKRGAIGEGCGVKREWRLPEFDEELVTVCAQLWGTALLTIKLAPGHSDNVDAPPRVDVSEVDLVLEHELFPELANIWDGDDPIELRALVDTDICVFPQKDSEIVAHVAKGQALRAWIGGSPQWPVEYASLVIDSVEEVERTSDTAGFFIRKHFVVAPRSTANQGPQHTSD